MSSDYCVLNTSIGLHRRAGSHTIKTRARQALRPGGSHWFSIRANGGAIPRRSGGTNLVWSQHLWHEYQGTKTIARLQRTRTAGEVGVGLRDAEQDYACEGPETVSLNCAALMPYCFILRCRVL
jgi:hypothetical protein